MRVLTGRSLAINCERSLRSIARSASTVEQIERENVVAEESEQTPEATAAEENEEPRLWRRYRNSPPLKISITDPDAALSSKRGASEFAHYDNYLIDSRSRSIMSVIATPARLSQAIVAARQLLKEQRNGLARTNQRDCRQELWYRRVSVLALRSPDCTLYPRVGSETTNKWLLYAA